MSPHDESALVLPVRREADLACCGTRACSFALSIGFPPREASAVAIVACELASNILRHADRGSVSLRRLAAPEGIEIIAADRGPGIGDLALATRDGFSRGRANALRLCRGEGVESLGCGLGAIRRLSDEVEIESHAGLGTTVTARKWLRRSPGVSIVDGR